jgi:hypothetical protein
MAGRQSTLMTSLLVVVYRDSARLDEFARRKGRPVWPASLAKVRFERTLH